MNLREFTLFRFDRIASTNQILWDFWDGGIHPPMVAIARQQTAGRGQWGRQWQSVCGGLYFSIAFNPKLPVTDAAHLTLFTAWGIADALRNNHIPVSLKWPNDLALSGKKLGGIKTETRIQENLIQQAVIGVGINWQNPVPDVGINLMSWFQEADYWPLQSLEELSAIAISGLLKGYERYQNEGIRSILSDYLSLLQNVGQQVTVEGNIGTIVGVTPSGELQVRFRSTGSSTEVAFTHQGVFAWGMVKSKQEVKASKSLNFSE